MGGRPRDGRRLGGRRERPYDHHAEEDYDMSKVTERFTNPTYVPKDSRYFLVSVYWWWSTKGNDFAWWNSMTTGKWQVQDVECSSGHAVHSNGNTICSKTMNPRSKKKLQFLTTKMTTRNGGKPLSFSYASTVSVISGKQVCGTSSHGQYRIWSTVRQFLPPASETTVSELKKSIIVVSGCTHIVLCVCVLHAEMAGGCMTNTLKWYVIAISSV